MTRRPDVFDHARARTPSPGWHPRNWRFARWGDLRLVYAELAALKQRITVLEERP